MTTKLGLTSYDAGIPANVDAEKVILGAILLDNACYYECTNLEADCFYLDSHRRIFLRMGQMLAGESVVDLVTLSNELGRTKEIESVGGVAYLASLTEGLPRRPVIDEYIRIVRDKSLLRRVMGICSDAVIRAADQSEASEVLISDVDRQLLEIARSSAREPSLVSQTEVAFQELADLRTGKHEPAVSTGLLGV